MTAGASSRPWLPAARIVNVEGRGEFFVRHHRRVGATGPTILLVHGWMASADTQFFAAYPALAERFSFVGIDLVGHGRGPRSLEPFTLERAADDVAGVLAVLGLDSVIAVGYSMGGPVAMLLGRRHPEVVVGLVLQATALEWNASLRDRLGWRLLRVLGRVLRSRRLERMLSHGFARLLGPGHPAAAYRDWLIAETLRNDPSVMVEAGRAIAVYDATTWASRLAVPTASLITTHDRLVKPFRQRALAALVGATVAELPADHLGALTNGVEYTQRTLELIDEVRAQVSAADTGDRAAAPSSWLATDSTTATNSTS